jgi:molecular chaperone DnaK
MEQAQQEVAVEEGLKIGMVKKYASVDVTNVASHSFGIIALNTRTNSDVIANLVLVNQALPISKTQSFPIIEAGQESAELKVMENSYTTETVEDVTVGEEIGNAVLNLPPGLPAHALVEVTFELNREGRLHVTAREPRSNMSIEANIETSHGISEEELAQAQKRSTRLVIS